MARATILKQGARLVQKHWPAVWHAHWDFSNEEALRHGLPAYKKWLDKEFKRRFPKEPIYQFKMPYYTRSFRARARRRRRLNVTGRSKKRARVIARRKPMLNWNKSSLGERVGTSIAKTDYLFENVTGNKAYKPDELYGVNVTNISASNDYNVAARSREVINMRGIVVKLFAKNTKATPAMLHLAVVCPKAETWTVQAGNVMDTVAKAGFFREYGTNRQLSFTKSNSGLYMNTAPINADAMQIIWRKDLYLGPESQANSFMTGVTLNFRSLNKYIPIKRQLRYTGVTGTTCETPAYLVWWYSNSDRASGDYDNTATTYEASMLVHGVFKEPKNG